MKPIDLYYQMPYFIRYPIFVVTGAVQAYNRYGSGFRSKYDSLMQNLSMSSDEIHAMQTESMQRMLIHAYEHVPYYKRMFNSISFHPKDYREISDLVNLPILTKEIIKENFNDLIADNVHRRGHVLHRTGGTTGEPTLFYLPKTLKGDFNYATLYRFYSWGGVHFREPRVSIAGRLTTRKPPYAMRNLAENQLYVCAHHLQEENLYNIISPIKKFNPSFVQGHPSAIAMIARFMLKTEIKIPVKAVFTTSENLYTDQRALIEDAFSCKVFDTYGMGEMVAMASECSEHKGYHLAPEYGVTEVINEDSYENGVGEIVSTSLQNYAMPLIKYKSGDIGKITSAICPCGCNFPMLEGISGRIDDVLKMSDGRIVLPLSVRIQMKNIGLSDFQVIQNKNGTININIFGVYDNTHKQQLSKTVIRALQQILGESDSLCVDYDKEPILTKNGKQQMVIKHK